MRKRVFMLFFIDVTCRASTSGGMLLPPCGNAVLGYRLRLSLAPIFPQSPFPLQVVQVGIGIDTKCGLPFCMPRRGVSPFEPQSNNSLSLTTTYSGNFLPTFASDKKMDLLWIKRQS